MAHLRVLGEHEQARRVPRPVLAEGVPPTSKRGVRREPCSHCTPRERTTPGQPFSLRAAIALEFRQGGAGFRIGYKPSSGFAGKQTGVEALAPAGRFRPKGTSST